MKNLVRSLVVLGVVVFALVGGGCNSPKMGVYNLNVTPPREGAKDVNQAEIKHAFIERVTFVIGKDGKILASLSSKTDGLSPDQHVHKSLEIVTASK